MIEVIFLIIKKINKPKDNSQIRKELDSELHSCHLEIWLKFRISIHIFFVDFTETHHFGRCVEAGFGEMVYSCVDFY